MSDPSPLPIIRIAAALITDSAGRVALVRKRGTRALIQPGGKIEPGEAATDALRRELAEELGMLVLEVDPVYLGTFTAPAVHEAGRTVEAQLFRVDISGPITPAAEIEAVVWIDPFETDGLDLAPLTRDQILPLARSPRPVIAA